MQDENCGITKPLKRNMVASRSQSYTSQQRFTMTVRGTHLKCCGNITTCTGAPPLYLIMQSFVLQRACSCRRAPATQNRHCTDTHKHDTYMLYYTYVICCQNMLT